MKTSDFNFHLPEELIAQHPLEKRDNSRLMVLDKATGEIEHKHFYDVLNYLNPGDTLVLNNTRVLPARLIGEKENTGGKIEFLLLKRIEGDKWECLAKPGKRAKIGTIFTFGEGKLKCKVVDLCGKRAQQFICQCCARPCIFHGIFRKCRCLCIHGHAHMGRCRKRISPHMIDG